jgi:CRP-like cAMP-binding protein
VDVRAFLADHPPFDALTDEELDRVVASVQIEHFAPGTVILQQAGAPATHLFVVRRGAAEIVDGGRVIDEIGEGEVFGMWSLLGQVAPTATVRAGEDTLCYLIDAEVANAVLRSGGGIAFVAGSVRRRIAQIDEARRGEVDLVRYQQVGALVRRTPVTCEPETQVADAAAILRADRVRGEAVDQFARRLVRQDDRIELLAQAAFANLTVVNRGDAELVLFQHPPRPAFVGVAARPGIVQPDARCADRLHVLDNDTGRRRIRADHTGIDRGLGGSNGFQRWDALGS